MSPSGSRKIFPAWSRDSHMLRPSGARMVSDPVDNHHRTCSHRPSSNRRSRAPQSQYCPYCSPYSSVIVEGLAGGQSLHDRCANFGRGLDSALQSGKRPLALDVGCTKYMVQRKICRSRERDPYGPSPTQARGGFWRLTQNCIRAVASQRRIRPRLPSLIPPFSASLSWRDVSEVVPRPCSGD